MHICLLCRDINAKNGLNQATADLARTLATRGHEATVISNARLPDVPPSSRLGSEVITAPDFELGSWEDELAYAIAAYRRADEIHAEQPIGAVLAPLWRSEGLLCLLDDRFPTITSCITPLLKVAAINPAARHWPAVESRMAMEREALRCSRYLHGLTDVTLREVISEHQLTPVVAGVARRGLIDRCSRAPGEGRSPGPARVLFIGRLEHRKGIDLLLTAAQRLLRTGASATFTIAGANIEPRLLVQVLVVKWVSGQVRGGGLRLVVGCARGRPGLLRSAILRSLDRRRDV